MRYLTSTGLEQSTHLRPNQLAAADLVLDQAMLDGIDDIVPPGATIDPADGGWANPALRPAGRRRQGAA
jgi:hypothetical protein